MGPGVAALTIASLLLPALGGFAAVGFATRLKPWVEEFGDSAWLLYAPLFALLTGCTLMPTYALSFCAGVFFGVERGSLVAVAGVIGGALLGYLWGVLVARKRVMQQIETDPRASAIRAAIIDRPMLAETGVVALLRFPPNSPFAFTNLVLSATGVRFGSFVLGTALGMTPRTVLAAWIGRQAGSISEIAGATGLWKWIGLGVTIVVIAVLYQLFSRWAKAALSRRANGGRAGD